MGILKSRLSLLLCAGLSLDIYTHDINLSARGAAAALSARLKAFAFVTSLICFKESERTQAV